MDALPEKSAPPLPPSPEWRPPPLGGVPGEMRWPYGPPARPPEDSVAIEHVTPPGWSPAGGVPAGGAPTYPHIAPSEPPTTLSVATSAAIAGRPAVNNRQEATGCAALTAALAVLSKLALVGKVLLPLGSAAVSLGAYALLFGWQFGVGILALLTIHEMGHFVVIRAKGLPASLPVFIPLLGAYVAMKRMPQNVRDEAEIAIAGPLVGALASAACFGIYQATGITVFLPLAYFSFFLNLINLIPVSPLDGGRIVGAISRWIWPVGLALVLVAFIYTQNILLLVLLWLGALQTMSLFRGAGRTSGYYDIPLTSRAYITLVYFGLAAMLAIGMAASQGLMTAGGGFHL